MRKKHLIRAIVKSVLNTAENKCISNQWVNIYIALDVVQWYSATTRVLNMVCASACKCYHTPFPCRPGITSTSEQSQLEYWAFPQH